MKKIRVLLCILAIAVFSANVVYADTSEETRLCIDSQKGNLVWYCNEGKDPLKFMSFTDMLPGETYSEGLIIENHSKKTNDLFLEMIPVEQEEISNKLLEKIHLKILQNGREIYKGNAKGETLIGRQGRIFPIGTYESGDIEEMKVEVTLDDSIDSSYQNILTEVDWKFMVKEDEDSLKPVNPVKTGDSDIDSLLIYGIIVLIASMGIFCAKKINNN